jgi:hypothetical protein
MTWLPSAWASTVNARTLTTVISFCKNAIENHILITDRFEFITLTPTESDGLPGSVNAGESFSFQIVGVRDVTRTVRFDALVTPISPTELKGSAFTVVLYKDYNIRIPSVPSVPGVDMDVRLEIDLQRGVDTRF